MKLFQAHLGETEGRAAGKSFLDDWGESYVGQFPDRRACRGAQQQHPNPPKKTDTNNPERNPRDQKGRGGGK